MRLLLRLLIVLAVLAGLVVTLDYAAPERMAALSLKLQRAAAKLEEKRTQIPGYEIAYLEGGSGEPLVLVHGIGADKDNFDRVAMKLTAHYRVISIDLPGFGESAKPADGDYGISAQVAHLGQILDALGLERVHLGGSSMGGWIVANFAAAQPQRVQSLWLLAASGVRAAQLSEVRKAWLDRGEYRLFSRSPAEFEQVLDTVFVERPFLPHSVRQVLAARAAANYELHTAIFRRLMQEWEVNAVDAHVKGLAVPTLLMWGEEDRAVDVSSVKVLQGLMPNAQAVIYPGVGHLPMLEAWREAARDYLAFRSRLAT